MHVMAEASQLQKPVLQEQQLPPLGPGAASLAGPRSSLVLADPQLLPLPPAPIAFPRRQLELNFAVLLARRCAHVYVHACERVSAHTCMWKAGALPLHGAII